MKKMKMLAFLLLLLLARARSEPWNSESGLLLKYDKVEHFLFFGGVAALSENAWKYSLALGVVNEIKDQFLPYQKYGWIGGDGFSKKDLIANCVGIAVGYCVNRFIVKKIF